VDLSRVPSRLTSHGRGRAAPRAARLPAREVMRLSKLLKVAKLQAIFRRLNEAFGMPYTWGSLVTCVAFQHDATHAHSIRGAHHSSSASRTPPNPPDGL
jgi:hypothetical protein